MRVICRSLVLSAILAASPAARAQSTENGHPAVSPDGRLIAFIATRSGHARLCLIGLDGRNERELSVPDLDRSPRWSSVRELTFTGSDADSGKIFSFDVDRGTLRVVANVPGRTQSLSPDGHRVLYLVGPWTSTSLVVADTDGGHARTLAGGRTTAWNGTWSPDGMRVAYTYGDSTRLLQVHVIDRDGGGDRAVTHSTRDEGSAQLPEWSPDGRWLAVQVNRLPTHSSEIWIVSVANGEVHRIAPHEAPYLDETPSWFPDGKRLAFQSNRTGTMEVWVMNADGSNPVQITGRPKPPGGGPQQR